MTHRDEVFVPGGQPTITYVNRQNKEVEQHFRRAIATPNQIVSLSASTKTGKTVLCKRVLGSNNCIWLDGGSLSSSEDFWSTVFSILNIPRESTHESHTETEMGISGGIPLALEGSGSQLAGSGRSHTFVAATPSAAIDKMLADKAVLVIDDFHYLPKQARTEILRGIKGAVFRGLKVVLLSVSHRAFEALKAESELTGRFTAVILPEWSHEELEEIPRSGFNALNVKCSDRIISRLSKEAQENPFLMQQFCWDICYHSGIESKTLLPQRIPDDYNLEKMFIRIAQDAGLPIYKKLVLGPQSKGKSRQKRPLKAGGVVDIYEAILKALAQTGPKATISYEEVREELTALLKPASVPIKHEVTSALKHLVVIARKVAEEAESEPAIDWDDDNREVAIADPFLRFYLRWQVKQA